MQSERDAIGTAIAVNRIYWDAKIRLRPSEVNNACTRVISGLTGTLRYLEVSTLSPIRNERLLHVQCNDGVDTLSWARLGARVVGIDFSPAAIQFAKKCAESLNLPARFLCADVSAEWPIERETFDIAVASYGILEWIPNITLWMQNVASSLCSQGRLFLVDTHPDCYRFLNPAIHVDKPDRACYTTARGRSMGIPGQSSPFIICRWRHSVNEVIESAAKAGFKVLSLELHDMTFYPIDSSSTRSEDGYWRHPLSRPLMFSLLAEKTGCEVPPDYSTAINLRGS